MFAYQNRSKQYDDNYHFIVNNPLQIAELAQFKGFIRSLMSYNYEFPLRIEGVVGKKTGKLDKIIADFSFITLNLNVKTIIRNVTEEEMAIRNDVWNCSEISND